MSPSATFTVEAKVVGRRRPLFAGWHISLPPTGNGDGIFSLRDLISLVVTDEVEAFRQRQEERRFTRVLDKDAIALGVAQGKIDMGGHDIDQSVEAETAIAVALQAFEDGLYFVFIDDVQSESLDQQVFLRSDSRVLFLRLIALAGG
jgi:hypothetical protein